MTAYTKSSNDELPEPGSYKPGDTLTLPDSTAWILKGKKWVPQDLVGAVATVNTRSGSVVVPAVLLESGTETKVSALTAAGSLNGAETLLLVQSGASRKAALSVVAYAQAALTPPKHVLVAGGAAGDITATGIKLGDRLDEVLEYVYAAAVTTDVLDLTAEFTITADDTVNNTAGSDTTGNKLMIRWTKLTA